VAIPTTRQTFAEHCLRRLGGGVLAINVTDDQTSDRIDEAVNYYQRYHHSGSVKTYLSHQVTDADKVNRYLTLDESIIGVVRLFPLSTMIGSQSLFSLNYQFAQSDFLRQAISGSIVPYWMAMSHISLIQQVLMGEQPVRFNEHHDRVYIDMDWSRVATGDYIVVEAYQALNPETYTLTGTTAASSATLTSVGLATDGMGVTRGMVVSGTGITSGSTVVSRSGATVVLSDAATATGTVSLTFTGSTDMWGDHWLQRYATALLKRQWGNNLSKYTNMPLAGGVAFDGLRILQEAAAEIDKLESEMINSFSLPSGDFVG
jgi:hypothetical protein